MALRILGDTADAEEVTLDVYTQVWRTAQSFDAQRGNTSAWLVMLARSRAIDRLRSGASRKQREEPLEVFPEISAAAESPEQSAAHDQQRRLVRAALDALPGEQREAVELAFFSGLSHSGWQRRSGSRLGRSRRGSGWG